VYAANDMIGRFSAFLECNVRHIMITHRKDSFSKTKKIFLFFFFFFFFLLFFRHGGSFLKYEEKNKTLSKKRPENLTISWYFFWQIGNNLLLSCGRLSLNQPIFMSNNNAQTFSAVL